MSPKSKKRELEKHASDLTELEDKIKKLKKRISSKNKLDFVNKNKEKKKKKDVVNIAKTGFSASYS